MRSRVPLVVPGRCGRRNYHNTGSGEPNAIHEELWNNSLIWCVHIQDRTSEGTGKVKGNSPASNQTPDAFPSFLPSPRSRSRRDPCRRRRRRRRSARKTLPRWVPTRVLVWRAVSRRLSPTWRSPAPPRSTAHPADSPRSWFLLLRLATDLRNPSQLDLLRPSAGRPPPATSPAAHRRRSHISRRSLGP
jgi:hypothetical protein